jgi:hypothetical protein
VRDRATAAGANAVLAKTPNKRGLIDTLATLIGPASEREHRSSDALPSQRQS